MMLMILGAERDGNHSVPGLEPPADDANPPLALDAACPATPGYLRYSSSWATSTRARSESLRNVWMKEYVVSCE